MPPEESELRPISPDHEYRWTRTDRLPTLARRGRILAQAQFGQTCVQALTNDAAVAQLHFVHAMRLRPFVAFRRQSIMNTRTRGSVKSVSLHHFSVTWPGAITNAVYGRPSACVCTAPREIRVLPVPHSAITAPARACCQTRVKPIMARVCAGKGLRSSLLIRGDGGSSTACKGGKDFRILSQFVSVHSQICWDIAYVGMFH